MGFLYDLWHLEIAVLPVILSMAIVEFWPFIRSYFFIPYIPIYFALYPLNVLNKDLGEYLNEDSWYGQGNNLSEQELKDKKNYLLKAAFLAVIISIAVVPVISGFLCAFILPQESMLGFCFIFIAYKLIGIIKAFNNMEEHSAYTLKNVLLFNAVYIVYFIMFIYIFNQAHSWTIPFIKASDWIGLGKGLFDLLLNEIIFKTVFLGVLVSLVIFLFANKKYRRPNYESE